MTRCSCAVDGCQNTSNKQPNLKFFRLPVDPVRAKRWMKLIGWSETPTHSQFHYVCEEHFTPDCFYSHKPKLLVRDALPCVNLPSTSKDYAMVHKSTQYKSQEKKKKEVKPQANRRETFFELCDKYLEKDIATVVKAQSDLKNVISKNKHEIGYDNFCLKFYYTSPAGYSGLQSFLGLPDRKTLGNLIVSSVIANHKKIFTTLKAKVDCMSDLEKHCTILVGLVELKPHFFYHIKDDKLYGFVDIDGVQMGAPADKAIIIFVRGIYEPWVLAVDYALFPKEDLVGRQSISAWVVKNILELFNIGLNIRVCISNMRPESIIASAIPPNKPLNKNKPYFIVKNKHLYYMKDPTQIIKNIHDAFKEFEFRSLDAVAKWEDIVEFYNIDSKKRLRLAPKLSEEHISDASETPYHVVVDTLSETVAAGMAACIELGAMDASAWGTVKFLTVMSILIDFTHSCNASHQRQLKRPFEGSETQLNLIIEAVTYFAHLNLFKNNLDVTHRRSFLMDIQIAIKSLLMLSEDLKKENNPKLFTRYINLNEMNRFVNSVSKKNRKTGALLAWKLIREFRNMFSRTILQTPKYRYCPEVLNGVFFEYLNSLKLVESNAGNRTRTTPKSFVRVRSLSLPVKMVDYKYINLPKTCQINAISSFVLQKCLEVHVNCTLPMRNRKRNAKEDEVILDERYPQYRHNMVTKTVIPDAHFIAYIWALENEFKNFVSNGFFLNHRIMSALDCRADTLNDSFESPCPCFPTGYLKKLFFRLRLRLLLKMNNKTYTRNAKKLTFGYLSLP